MLREHRFYKHKYNQRRGTLVDACLLRDGSRHLLRDAVPDPAVPPADTDSFLGRHLPEWRRSFGSKGLGLVGSWCASVLPLRTGLGGRRTECQYSCSMEQIAIRRAPVDGSARPAQFHPHSPIRTVLSEQSRLHWWSVRTTPCTHKSSWVACGRHQMRQRAPDRRPDDRPRGTAPGTDATVCCVSVRARPTQRRCVPQITARAIVCGTAATATSAGAV